MNKINLSEKFSLFEEHWSPKIIGELNDSYIKIVKFKGEFVWHHHINEDELFFVVKGTMIIRMKENATDKTFKEIIVNPGELIIIPKGVEHMPVAEEEVQVMLMELKSTLNTGNIKNERTVEDLKKI